MKCPVCKINELVGKQSTCSLKCRVALSRRTVTSVTAPSVTLARPTVTSQLNLPEVLQFAKANNLGGDYKYHYWLYQRCNGAAPIAIKLGNPAGSKGQVHIPLRWELDDLDMALYLLGHTQVKPKETVPMANTRENHKLSTGCTKPNCTSTTVTSAQTRQQPTTALDKELEATRPGFYTFISERSGTCATCSKPYRTTLASLRFCSLQCKRDVMIPIAHA